jgi:hypothetical protein
VRQEWQLVTDEEEIAYLEKLQEDVPQRPCPPPPAAAFDGSIVPHVRALVHEMHNALGQQQDYGWSPMLHEAKWRLRKAHEQAIKDAVPKRDRPDRRPAAAAASRKLMQQAKEEEEVSQPSNKRGTTLKQRYTGSYFACVASSSCPVQMREKARRANGAVAEQTVLQRKLFRLRKRLAHDVSEGGKRKAACAAARIYQLTHCPQSSEAAE